MHGGVSGTDVYGKKANGVHGRAVRPRAIQREIGTELFLHVQEEAKTKGAERLDLMVWGFNEKAYAFYERLGMSVQRFVLEKKL